MQILGYHEAQHRNSRSEIIGNLQCDLNPPKASEFEKSAATSSDDAALSETQRQIFVDKHFDDIIPELFF
jgi:hypothetical protein